MSLRQKAVRGVAWSALQKWGAQGISFFLFLILARLLDPTIFGLIALAFVFTEFVQLFLDQGMGQAIIQFETLDDEHIDTAFWASLGTAVLMSIGGVLLSDWIALLFKEPALSLIIAWLSINFIIFSFSTVQQALLQRQLDFKGLAMRTLTAKIVGGVAGVITAVMGFGVWSLVIQTLVTGFVGVIVLWRVVPWRPKLRFSVRHFKDMFSFGISTMLVRILNYLDLRIDDFLIGYFLGTTILGYYTVAYRILLTMLNVLTAVTATVAFPTFAKLQTDLKKLRNVYYETTHLVSLIVLPAFGGFFIIAPNAIPLLFGEKWIPSIQVAQILSIGGVFIAIMQFSGSLAWAIGKPNYVLGVRSVSTFVRIVAFSIGVQFGLIGVALAYTLAIISVFMPLYFWLPYKLIEIQLKEYLKQLKIPAMSAFSMMAVLLGINFIFDSLEYPSESFIQLGTQLLVGGFVYLLMLWFLDPTILQLVRNIRNLLLSKKTAVSS